MLQADLTRRQESYIRRERAFNMRIKELEEEVGNLKVDITQPKFVIIVVLRYRGVKWLNATLL